MMYTQEIWFSGIILAFIGFLIPFLHFIRCFIAYNKDFIPSNTVFNPPLTILLPVKNEEIVIKEKINELLKMNYPLEKISLLILDSQSIDNTIQIADNFLKSVDKAINYQIISVEQPGKSFAINHALDLIETDFFVMMDAEAILYPDSLQKITRWFNDESIGAVCGKFSPEYDDLDYNYRKNFNIIRLGESTISSTPIFEGSICAFRMSSLQGEKINPNVNSDDSQLSLISIRNGFRSIMDKELLFLEPSPERKDRRKRQLRRSQGLIRTLFINRKMIFTSNIKSIYFNAFFFHIIMPWIFLISILCLFCSTLFSIFDYGFFSLNIYNLSFLFFMAMCVSSFFRNFLFGISILMEAQLLLLFGIKLNIWETNTNLRQKSSDFRKKS